MNVGKERDGPGSDGPPRAVGLSCVWSLMKDPLLHEKHSAVVEGAIARERERKSPSLALLEISTKERWG